MLNQDTLSQTPPAETEHDSLLTSIFTLLELSPLTWEQCFAAKPDLPYPSSPAIDKQSDESYTEVKLPDAYDINHSLLQSPPAFPSEPEPPQWDQKALHRFHRCAAQLAKNHAHSWIAASQKMRTALDQYYETTTFPFTEAADNEPAPVNLKLSLSDDEKRAEQAKRRIFNVNADLLTKILSKASPLADFREACYHINTFWQDIEEAHPGEYKHPLVPVFEEIHRCHTTRTLSTATADHINKTFSTPYVISEINRTVWIDESDMTIVRVDGELVANIIKELPPPDKNRNRTILRPRRAGNQRLQGLLFNTERNPEPKPIPLLAYEEFGRDLRNSSAQDTAFLLKLVYASNQPLRITAKEGAQLLARSRKGTFRRIRQSDIDRFGNAYLNARGLHVWLVDGTGYSTPFEVVKAERPDLHTGEFLIEQPGWWKRAEGRWTLSGGLNPHRLAGHAENKLQRYIDGVEFWLARAPFSNKGTNKGIAKTLIPDGSRTAGAGEWITLDWRTFLRLGGDHWDDKNKTADNSARQRWNRLKDLLTTHGYTVRGKHQRSLSGDTIEFRVGHGGCMVRTTARFTEAARKAQNNQWESIELKKLIKLS